MSGDFPEWRAEDAGAGRLTFARGPGPGGAMVAATMGGGLPAFVRLRSHQVVELRDWLNALLERDAHRLPVVLPFPASPGPRGGDGE